jgi:hypothetical protein
VNLSGGSVVGRRRIRPFDSLCLADVGAESLGGVLGCLEVLPAEQDEHRHAISSSRSDARGVISTLSTAGERTGFNRRRNG